MLKKVTI